MPREYDHRPLQFLHSTSISCGEGKPEVNSTEVCLRELETVGLNVRPFVAAATVQLRNPSA